jgi:hypothetical protein
VCFILQWRLPPASSTLELPSSSAPILYKRTVDEITNDTNVSAVDDCDEVEFITMLDSTTSVKRQARSTPVDIDASTSDTHASKRVRDTTGPVFETEIMQTMDVVKCTVVTPASDDHWQNSSFSLPMYFYVQYEKNRYVADVVVTVQYTNVHTHDRGSYTTGVVCLVKDEQERIIFDRSSFQKSNHYDPLYFSDLSRFATVYFPVVCKLYDECVEQQS